MMRLHDRNVEVSVFGDVIGRGTLIQSRPSMPTGTRFLQVSGIAFTDYDEKQAKARFPLSITVGPHIYEGRFIAPIMRRDGRGVMHQDYEFVVKDYELNGLDRALERVNKHAKRARK